MIVQWFSRKVDRIGDNFMWHLIIALIISGTVALLTMESQMFNNYIERMPIYQFLMDFYGLEEG